MSSDADRREAFLRRMAPEQDETLSAMDERARTAGFPHVGPVVGGLLYQFARMIDAERVFEFGSGFGYSAYWFARAVGPDGEVVLTEVDADELADAREYLAAGGLAERARFEVGDAMATIEDTDGPIDVALIDHDKERYWDAFEAVRPKLAEEAIVVADNAMRAGPVVVFEDLARLTAGEDVPDATDETRAVAEYLGRVRNEPAFTTVVLPVGSGIAVSYRDGSDT